MLRTWGRSRPPHFAGEEVHDGRRVVSRLVAGCAAVAALGATGGRARRRRQADKPNRPPDVERRIDALIRQMTLEEKLNQLTLLSDGQINDAEAAQARRRGLQPHRSGEDRPLPADRRRAVAAAHPDPVRVRHDPRLPDDLPDPAGDGLELRSGGCPHRPRDRRGRVRHRRLSSRSTARWSTSRTSRAGAASREAAGEDPYPQLRDGRGAREGRAGRRLRAPNKVVTSVKHYAAYGQPEAGRDYNTTDMSLSRLWNYYLPPFKAAVDAGADTAMCSFNAINGEPGCANHYLENARHEGPLGLRRLHRERLHGRRRAAGVPAA